jgi:lysophospholipase L1-like esterase
MGDSMTAWRKSNFAMPDGIHFTREGYALLGQLLFNAIIKPYEAGH